MHQTYAPSYAFPLNTYGPHRQPHVTCFTGRALSRFFYLLQLPLQCLCMAQNEGTLVCGAQVRAITTQPGKAPRTALNYAAQRSSSQPDGGLHVHRQTAQHVESPALPPPLSLPSLRHSITVTPLTRHTDPTPPNPALYKPTHPPTNLQNKQTAKQSRKQNTHHATNPRRHVPPHHDPLHVRPQPAPLARRSAVHTQLRRAPGGAELLQGQKDGRDLPRVQDGEQAACGGGGAGVA
ncbi:hypothetical protein DFP73DRAFT_526398 [Morchella snyderi]|nr:hypothetical protein DFP73DRAFT_526398 [Morchella snyderi]